LGRDLVLNPQGGEETPTFRTARTITGVYATENGSERVTIPATGEKEYVEMLDWLGKTRILNSAPGGEKTRDTRSP